MKKCHLDKKLNKLLGSTIRITFFDDTSAIGILETDSRYPYKIGNILFYKSHVKKVELIVNRCENGRK